MTPQEEELFRQQQMQGGVPSAVKQAVDITGATPPSSPVPNPGTMPPPALDNSSAMTPQEIGLDNIQKQATQAPLAQPRMQVPLSAPLPGAYEAAKIQQDKGSGGFDWGRAFLSAGGGDVAAYDANKRYQNEKPQRDANEAAQQLQQQQARDMLDPASSLSREAQQRYAKVMLSRASAPGVSSQMADLFRQEAEKASTMTAMQVDRANQTFGSLMGEYGKLLDADATRALTGKKLGLQQEQIEATKEHNQQTSDIAKQKVGLEVANLSETRRHHQAIEGITANKENNKMPPGEIGKSQIELDEGMRKIARAKQLLASGKIRYLGAGANTLNTLMSKDPTGKLDIRNPEEREFANLVAWIAAPERHALFGGSYTGNEKTVGEELFANIGRNKESTLQTLNTMEESGKTKRGQMHKLYPALNKLDQGGDPRVELAKQALEDPEATDADRAAAKKLLGVP